MSEDGSMNDREFFTRLNELEERLGQPMPPEVRGRLNELREVAGDLGRLARRRQRWWLAAVVLWGMWLGWVASPESLPLRASLFVSIAGLCCAAVSFGIWGERRRMVDQEIRFMLQAMELEVRAIQAAFDPPEEP